MKMPDCHDRFTVEGSSNTLMHSPIVYDREGKPVSGGGNYIKRYLKCLGCGKMWVSRQTELQDAQGVEREWKEWTYE